jgi:F-type H+-transporting ATPase subunit b
LLKLDWAIIWDIVNVLILFFFLKKFLFKPVTKIMEERKATVENSLHDADEKKAEAFQLKSDYEEELKHADEQASAIMKEARERAELEYNKKLDEAKAETERMIAQANKTIELDRKKSMESAQAEIAGIAMLAAAKVIGKNVDDNVNQQFLGDLLKEVGAAK